MLTSNPDIKNTIAEIVGIKVSDDWNIYSEIPSKGLYLISYTDSANMTESGHIRGIVVDIVDRKIVCSGYEYTPTVRIQNKLQFDENGKLELRDNLGRMHVVDKIRGKMFPQFDVVTIRVVLYKNEMYYSTYRQINIVGTRSRWGNSIPFIDMAIEAKLPDRFTLFPDSSKVSSNYVHIFILVHKGILNVTKDRVNEGYVIYVGHKKMWNADPDDNTIDTVPIQFETTDDIEVAKRDHIPFNPPEYTLEQANNFLTYGYYQPKDSDQSDPRTSNGEAVIIYLNDKNDPFKNVLRVQSTAAAWRSMIKGDHPNLKFTHYTLSTSAFNHNFDKEAEADFLRNFPLFAKFDVKGIQARIAKSPIHFWPKGPLPNIKDPMDRYYVVWVSLLMAVPLHRQAEVASFYYDYLKEKEETVSILYDLYEMRKEGNSYEELPINLYHRTTKLIELAKCSANKFTDKSDYDHQIKYNLSYLVNGEAGESLYRIYKDCRTLKDLDKY